MKMTGPIYKIALELKKKHDLMKNVFMVDALSQRLEGLWTRTFFAGNKLLRLCRYGIVPLTCRLADWALHSEAGINETKK